VSPSSKPKKSPARRPAPRRTAPATKHVKPKPASKSTAKPHAKTTPKSPAKAVSKPAQKAVARPPAKGAARPTEKSEPAPAAPPRPGDSRRHVLSLSFLRDGDEFLARLETDGGQITELKNRALDQLLTLVAGELEDLLE
jgi:hypothetical protein